MTKSKQFYINVDGQLVSVTEEIYLSYYRSKRRERYYTRDIKTESAVRDKDGNIIGYRASKEDSLERLMDAGEDYADENESVEEAVLHMLMSEKLHEAMKTLSQEEHNLIETLFFFNVGDGMSEREYAVISGIPHPTIHSRKVKVLAKLKNCLKIKKTFKQTPSANGK